MQLENIILYKRMVELVLALASLHVLSRCSGFVVVIVFAPKTQCIYDALVKDGEKWGMETKEPSMKTKKIKLNTANGEQQQQQKKTNLTLFVVLLVSVYVFVSTQKPTNGKTCN